MDDAPETADLASEFRLSLHSLAEVLHGLDDLRTDLVGQMEVSEEASLEAKRRSEALDRVRKETTAKTQEMLALESLSGDEKITRLNVELDIGRSNLRSLDGDLELLRAKVVEATVGKMAVERREKVQQERAEEEKKRRAEEWRQYDKARSELQTLVNVKDEALKDLKALEECAARTVNFNHLLERSIQDGEKCLLVQNDLLAHLRREKLQLGARLREKSARGEDDDEQAASDEQLRKALERVEADLRERMAEVEETEQALERTEKSNGALSAILEELESAERSRLGKMRDVGCQIGQDEIKYEVIVVD